jgi:hypothetical protein
MGYDGPNILFSLHFEISKLLKYKISELLYKIPKLHYNTKSNPFNYPSTQLCALYAGQGWTLFFDVVLLPQTFHSDSDVHRCLLFHFITQCHYYCKI